MVAKQKLLLKEFNKLKRVNKLSFRLPSMSGQIEMDPQLRHGRDHIPFARNKGEFRTLRLRFTSDPKEETGRLLRIYYGPWRTSRDHYIVLTKGQDILLDLGFTTTSRSIKFSNDSLLIRHLIRFFKRKSANNPALITNAMRRAKKLGLNLERQEKAVRLRRIDLKSGRRVPSSDQEVIKSFILSGLAKRGDLWAAAKRPAAGRTRAVVGEDSSDSKTWPGAANPKYKKKMVRFEVNLEKKAQNHKEHQEIINLLKRKLESQGYSCNATPEDLRAEKAKVKWIFEVKAWDPALEVSALWHAMGQVNWYCFKKSKYQPAIVLAHRPNLDSVNFVEKSCKIPLLWANVRNKTLAGGALAEKHFSL